MDFQVPDLDRFSLQVTVYFRTEDIPKFFEAFKPVFDKVNAEPELVYFEVFQDSGDPGKISWIENWDKSPEWFLKVQMTKEYYKDYLAITEPMFIQPREVKFLRRVGAPYVVSKPQNTA